MKRKFSWLTLAVALTAIVAVWVAGSPELPPAASPDTEGRHRLAGQRSLHS